MENEQQGAESTEQSVNDPEIKIEVENAQETPTQQEIDKLQVENAIEHFEAGNVTETLTEPEEPGHIVPEPSIEIEVKINTTPKDIHAGKKDHADSLTHDPNLNEELHDIIPEEHHEEYDHHDEIEEEDIDFTGLNLKDIMKVVENALDHPESRNENKKVQIARAEFFKIVNEEKKELLEKFVSDGNDPQDFDPTPDPIVKDFNLLFRSFKKKRQEYIESLNKQREDNLLTKKEILDKLKAITEADDTSGNSYDAFKRLQDEWRHIGHVPVGDAENLWNKYNFYVDKFYNKMSLYSEFIELDRKKNLEAKEEVVGKLESLAKVENVNEALRNMRQYQEEWKHIGPVPKESLDDMINRYKAAVILLHEKREKLSEELQKRREQNYQAKKEILDKILEIANTDYKSAQEWINKNKDLGGWIEKWRGIGNIPIEKRDNLKEQFSEGIKTFNRRKNEYFRLRKKEKVDNLKQKMELCDKVEELLKHEDALSENKKVVIKLQEQWKKVGPVPMKFSEKVWKRFQGSCDEFFLKLSKKYSALDKEQQDNLALKTAVIEKAEALAAQEDIETPAHKVKELQDEFNNIGFVPFKEKDKIRKRFFKALNDILAKRKGSADVNDNLLGYKLTLETWAEDHGGPQKIEQEERKLQRDLRQIENEIVTLENNMQFFGRSKNADALKQGFDKQIEQLKVKMDDLHQKIGVIRSLDLRRTTY